MKSTKQTMAIAGIAVLVLAVAGPILADIIAAHDAQAFFPFFRHRFFGGFRGFGFGFGGPWWGGGCGGCCCGGPWW